MAELSVGIEMPGGGTGDRSRRRYVGVQDEESPKASLVSAIQSGRMDLFNRWLPFVTDLEDVCTVPKRTLLMFCVVKERMKMIEVLLSEGARVDTVDPRSKSTVLHDACERGLLELVRLFLGHLPGPEVLDARNRAGMTPVAMAVKNSHVPVLELLLEPLLGSRFAALPPAFAVDLNVADFEGKSPVYYAVSGKSHAALRRLLATSRCDLDAVTRTGQSALMQACIKGDLESVKLLLAASPPPDVNLKRNGKSALMMSCTKGDAAVVRELLSLKQMPNLWEVSGSKRTVMDYALRHGKPLPKELTALLRKQVDAMLTSALMSALLDRLSLDLIKLIAQFTM